jgi:hypothetical protein
MCSALCVWGTLAQSNDSRGPTSTRQPSCTVLGDCSVPTQTMARLANLTTTAPTASASCSRRNDRPNQGLCHLSRWRSGANSNPAGTNHQRPTTNHKPQTESSNRAAHAQTLDTQFQQQGAKRPRLGAGRRQHANMAATGGTN